jgi:hypothetical protein
MTAARWTATMQATPPPCVPAFIAYTVQVKDLAVTRALLRANRLPVADTTPRGERWSCRPRRRGERRSSSARAIREPLAVPAVPDVDDGRFAARLSRRRRVDAAHSALRAIIRTPTTSPTTAVADAAAHPHTTADVDRSPANNARSASTM